METVNSNKTVYKLCGHFNNSVPREPRRLTEKSAENLVHSGSPESNVGGSVRTVEVTCPENKDSYVSMRIINKNNGSKIHRHGFGRKRIANNNNAVISEFHGILK